jgi:hypothetical protein
MDKYIVFRADWNEEEGAENRLLADTGMLTDILAEHFDSSKPPNASNGVQIPRISPDRKVGGFQISRCEHAQPSSCRKHRFRRHQSSVVSH